MKLLNMSHPLSPENKAILEEKGFQILDVKVNIQNWDNLLEEVSQILMPHLEGVNEPIAIIPAGSSLVASLSIAMIMGMTGTMPDVIQMTMTPDKTWKVGSTHDLQNIKNQTRSSRK